MAECSRFIRSSAPCSPEITKYGHKIQWQIICMSLCLVESFNRSGFVWLPCAMGSVEGTHCLNRMTWLPTAFIRRCVSIVFLSFFFFVDFIATIHVDVIVFDGKPLFESTQLLAWCRCCMRGGQTLSPSEGPTWTTGVPGGALVFPLQHLPCNSLMVLSLDPGCWSGASESNFTICWKAFP